MYFTKEEIRLAELFRHHGLAWVPAAGHYIYDETGFCTQASPFQEKVYFILNYDFFMKKVGGVERFKEIMIWLPTWHDARLILRDHGVPDAQVVQRLSETRAIEQGMERMILYETIASKLGIETSSVGRR